MPVPELVVVLVICLAGLGLRTLSRVGRGRIELGDGRQLRKSAGDQQRERAKLIALCVVLIVISIPLILRMVPPNGIYGFRVVAHGGRSLRDLQFGEATVFVVGAEREGLPEEVLTECAALATIPTTGPAESLNVAAAGAIALYEWSRRSD